MKSQGPLRYPHPLAGGQGHPLQGVHPLQHSASAHSYVGSEARTQSPISLPRSITAKSPLLQARITNDLADFLKLISKIFFL